MEQGDNYIWLWIMILLMLGKAVWQTLTQTFSKTTKVIWQLVPSESSVPH